MGLLDRPSIAEEVLEIRNKRANKRMHEEYAKMRGEIPKRKYRRVFK